MSVLGKNKNSVEYWADSAGWYAGAIDNDYHRHRLNVIRSLIPADLYRSGKRIFDFGYGDAVHFPEFLDAGAIIQGVDASPEMIGFAKDRLSGGGYDPELVALGTADSMVELEDASFDAVLSFNVLAYLTDEEENKFYKEASRIIKPGGYLAVTHSNELFDMFSLNRYTAEFFNRHFVQDPNYDVSGMLTFAHKPEGHPQYNVRENPLTYSFKLKKFGFTEIKQSFSNLHQAPPQILGPDKTYPDTLRIPEEERWKLMFTCSTYGSCSQKNR